MTITTIRRRTFPAFLLTLAGTLTGCDLIKDIPVGTGYAAKNICSDYFLSHLDLTTVKKRYVAPAINPLPMIWQIQVDESRKTVAVRDSIFINQNLNVAYYREGLGCTLLHSTTPEELDTQAPSPLVAQPPPPAPWPLGDGPIDLSETSIDPDQLQAAVSQAFVESGTSPVNTLAVVVAHHGTLIAEQYAPGVDVGTRLIGWSMSKSVTSTLVGLLADQGILQPDAPAPVPEWTGTDKQSITLKDLLQMAAGLEWSETAQGPMPDQGRMLFVSEDNARYYLDKPQTATPGSVFNYSSGVSGLLGRIVQDQVGGTLADTHRFINESLFQRIGIEDAVLEFDTAGQPVGGAGVYMRARDWAKLGLLYARYGDWFGDRVISREWVDFSLMPSTANSSYGSQIWLNTEQKIWPYLPADSYAFRGFQEQIVLVIPRYDLIIVRLGVTFEPGAFDLESLVRGIIAATRDNV